MWMLNESFYSIAKSVLSNSPCALEMPAGTGKTHLLAASVVIASSQGKRSLILTHTNAGVDALRRRMSNFGVKANNYHIETITSWAFTLVRAYEAIAELKVPEIPDWSDSRKYIEAATKVAKSTAIGAMHSNSFDYFFVDEYQDCNVRQHGFIIAIAEHIKNTIVLGDRLQGIFGFGGETLVDWDIDVFSCFPRYEIIHFPYRWRESNPDLGQWLLDIRPIMIDGKVLDFSVDDVPGVRWVCSSVDAVPKVAYELLKHNETVVLLDKWPRGVAAHASRLSGFYSVMEELQGKFMVEELEKLPSEGDYNIATWLAIFAKSCAIGLSRIDRPILTSLDNNRSICHYKRDGLEDVLLSLDELRKTPSYSKLVEAASTIRHTKDIKVYRWEAWNDTIKAIESCILNGSSPVEELMRLRDRLRKIGRRPNSRIASRTLLVKGLEYDHVIVANMANMRDPRNLYVALTRAKKSVTLIGASPRVLLRND